MWTDAYLYFILGNRKDQHPYTDEHKRFKLLHRLNEISGVIVPHKAMEKFPGIALTSLNNDTAREQFLEVLSPEFARYVAKSVSINNKRVEEAARWLKEEILL